MKRRARRSAPFSLEARPRQPRRRLTVVVLVAATALYALVGGLPDGWRPGGPGSAPGNTEGDLRGAVTHVRDGDTIEVADTAVRIANLDCAERGDADGSRPTAHEPRATSHEPRATARMRELVARQVVVCDLEGRMSYDREVGTCALASSGEDLGEILIREGVCERWW